MLERYLVLTKKGWYGVTADDWVCIVPGLSFYGPYNEDKQHPQLVIYFAAEEWISFRELSDNEKWPTEYINGFFPDEGQG